MINQKAFLLFLLIVALGFFAAYWVENVANMPQGPVWQLAIFVGPTAVIYLVIHYALGKAHEPGG
jgi:hypothetical protein